MGTSKLLPRLQFAPKDRKFICRFDGKSGMIDSVLHNTLNFVFSERVKESTLNNESDLIHNNGGEETGSSISGEPCGLILVLELELGDLL